MAFEAWRRSAFGLATLAQNVGTIHHQKKLGPDRSWQMQKMCGNLEWTHVDNKGIIGELWREKWRGTLREVALVKARRSKKEKQEMTLCEKLVTEGNERA